MTKHTVHDGRAGDIVDIVEIVPLHEMVNNERFRIVQKIIQTTYNLHERHSVPFYDTADGDTINGYLIIRLRRGDDVLYEDERFKTEKVVMK